MNIPKNLLNVTSTYAEELNPTAIFKKSSYANILDDPSVSQYLVTITPSDVQIPIKGLLTSEFTYSMGAEWEALGLLESITSNFGLLNSLYKYSSVVMSTGGYANPANIGVSSEKIYKKGGYLDINIAYRVVDWEGYGAPLQAADELSRLCLPKDESDLSLQQFGANLTGTLVSETKNALNMLIFGKYIKQEHLQKLADDIEKAGGLAIAAANHAIEGIFSGLFGNAGTTIYNKFLSYFDDPRFLILAKSPPSVKITIGNYFSNSDMIIDSVTPKFSKQCSTFGPLYVDIDIKASSRRALLASSTQEGVGLLTGTNTKSRSYDMNTHLVPINLALQQPTPPVNYITPISQPTDYVTQR